ncbi:hypothetical protein Q8F55_001484 [Vanrija albida]|uniref:Uncharacterized protein n=1 Tax=Vanrija albida TaxID=181172 RepID=A0ABR3QGL6_9TREE
MCDAEGYLIPFTSAAYPMHIKLLPDRTGAVTTVTYDFYPHQLDIDVHRAFSEVDKYHKLLKAHHQRLREAFLKYCRLVVRAAKAPLPTPPPDGLDGQRSPAGGATPVSTTATGAAHLAPPADPHSTLGSMLDEIEAWLNQAHHLLEPYCELDMRLATRWTDLQMLVQHRLQTYADFVFYHNEAIRAGKRDAHDHALGYVLDRLSSAADQLKEADVFPKGKSQYPYAQFCVAVNKFAKDAREKPW